MSKEKSCLVTQNIIEKAKWYLDAPSTVIKADKGGDGHTTWKEKALQDLQDTLACKSGVFPEAAKRGIEFEKKVYTVVSAGVEVQSSEHFKDICNEVRGYQFYQKDGKHVQMDGLDLFFYAKYDAITADKRSIVDLKTTGKYREGKYVKGIQHKIYCYVSGAEYFKYVIAEWEEYPKIKAVHREEFIVKDREAMEKDILFQTRECFDTLKDLGLWEVYRTQYCLY